MFHLQMNNQITNHTFFQVTNRFEIHSMDTHSTYFTHKLSGGREESGANNLQSGDTAKVISSQ